MDRGLIALKLTMLRNAPSGLRRFGWVVGGLLVLGTWAAVAFAADPGVRHSVLTLSLALWLVGAMLGPVMVSGAGVLRADHFALLPVPRLVLGRGLLVAVFVGVGSAFVLAAMLATLGHAAAHGPVAILAALVGAALSWVFALALSRLVYGALGAAMRSRLGIEISGVQFGLMFAAFFTGWMVVSVAVESVSRLLRDGLPAGPVTDVLDAFPTSWPVLAVEAVGDGDVARAGLLLLALLALDLVVVAATIPLLVPRPVPTQRRRGRPRSVALVAGGGLLPATPTGAVVMKELRQWRRDAWRALESSTAVWTGVAIGVFALLGPDTEAIAAFAGLIVAMMISLSGCNLYGQDGSAVWQNVVGESSWSVRADVRGRQWALVLVFLPRALLVSVAFLVAAQAWWSAPIVAGLLPAVVGAACGAAVVVSAVGVSPGVDPRRRVGPNDANGNINLHVWVALVLTLVGAAPTGGMIVWTALQPTAPVVAATVAVGIANGFAAAWLLGRVAIGYLDEGMVDVFSRIRYARVFRAPAGRQPRGILHTIADATLRGEHKAAEYKQKDREKRLERARA